jgi:hypothetical protein
LPILYSYAEEAISGLGAEINPFEIMYAAMLRLTVGIVLWWSVAASSARCNTLEQNFHRLDESGTPLMVLFPWFFSWAEFGASA